MTPWKEPYLGDPNKRIFLTPADFAAMLGEAQAGAS